MYRDSREGAHIALHLNTLFRAMQFIAYEIDNHYGERMLVETELRAHSLTLMWFWKPNQAVIGYDIHISMTIVVMQEASG